MSDAPIPYLVEVVCFDQAVQDMTVFITVHSKYQSAAFDLIGTKFIWRLEEPLSKGKCGINS